MSAKTVTTARVTPKQDDPEYQQAIQNIKVGDKLRLQFGNRVIHLTVNLIEVK